MLDREHLRTIFDEDALLYDQARPGYPEALFDDIVAFSGIEPDGQVLEIGCGTGQATLPMARRGYHIVGIELGAHMAAVARQKLAVYPLVEIHVGAFEEWPLKEQAFDLVLSATAFHWIDPAISYQKTAHALKRGGTLALFWHEHVQSQASNGIFEVIQPIYQRERPDESKSYQPLLWPEQIAEPVKAEIEQTGLFGSVTVRRYTWDVTYTANQYLQLLNTYSDHRALDSERRAHLFNSIADVIETQYHGQITKGYLALLYLAQRK